MPQSSAAKVGQVSRAHLVQNRGRQIEAVSIEIDFQQDCR